MCDSCSWLEVRDLSPLEESVQASEVNMAYGRNELEIAGQTMLLVDGNKTHLVRSDADHDGDGQPAVPDWHFEQTGSWLDAYDVDELRAPMWADRTLCGRSWTIMATADGPTIVPWAKPSFAPDCGSCLRIVSRRLSSTEPDDRLALLSALAVEQVTRVGSAQVVGVPGDQTDAFRRHLQGALRARHLRGITKVIADTVFVVSDDAWDQVPADEKQASSRAAAAALDELLTGSASPALAADQDWVIDWRTWGLA
jgi:hypothetical protein